MHSSPGNKRLWVCWKEPETAPDPSDSVLTFLLPSAEQRLKVRHPGEVLFGREESLPIRQQARSTYLSISARLAAVPGPGGKTLRQLLSRGGKSSQWWYHPVSFKDCETDPAFDRIIALFTILKVAEDRRIRELVLVGGPEELAAILKPAFQVRVVSGRLRKPAVTSLRALASRMAWGVRAIYMCWLTGRMREPSASRRFDVALFGFWDWSFEYDQGKQSVSDRYFGDLPEAIEAAGEFSVGWFAWASKRPVQKYGRVCFLQSFLSPGDVLKAMSDFRPLRNLLNVWKRPDFQNVFLVDTLNLFPLFRRPLLDFPHARAQYAGVKQAGPGTINYAVQHASYCSEKTFLFLDPEIEFRGRPDGAPVPHPDQVMAMGTFAQELFLKCGYAPDQVKTTGSPRYDRIRTNDLDGIPKATNEIRLLLVGGTAVQPDTDMIDAACELGKRMPQLRISFRKHPFSRIQNSLDFNRYRNQMQLTSATLDEDLKSADIVLFTYSTVAEEAFLRGLVVWQWISQGFNGSALAEVFTIPRFGSVEAMREAIDSYRSDPLKYGTDRQTRDAVLKRLFYRSDGGAAGRIASIAVEALRGVTSS